MGSTRPGAKWAVTPGVARWLAAACFGLLPAQACDSGDEAGSGGGNAGMSVNMPTGGQAMTSGENASGLMGQATAGTTGANAGTAGQALASAGSTAGSNAMSPGAETGAAGTSGPAPMAGTMAQASAGTESAGSAGAAAAGAAAGSQAGAAGAQAGSAGTQGTAGTMGGAGGADSAAGTDAQPPAEEVNVAVEGPHSYDTFTEGARAPEYAEGLVYYPTDSDGPFPVMILSPGLTANNTDYEIWGRVLSSHGIVALLMQPTDVLDWNDQRAVDLQAALGVVRGALNESGPLAGKLDTANVGFMGQSMGGGGTLIAANDVGDEIQAAIPMEPYAPGASFPAITTPTLIIAAELDTVAGVSQNAYAHYNSIPDSTTKIYLEGKGADHYFSTDRYEDDFDINARYAVAFLKLYLEGDTRYEPYLYGAEHDAVADQISRYLTSN